MTDNTTHGVAVRETTKQATPPLSTEEVIMRRMELGRGSQNA